MKQGPSGQQIFLQAASAVGGAVSVATAVAPRARSRSASFFIDNLLQVEDIHFGEVRREVLRGTRRDRLRGCRERSEDPP
jgi:hypothetical protein